MVKQAKKQKPQARWISPGLVCQTRSVGELVWREVTASVAVRVPDDAAVDALGRVTFRAGETEYRVGVKQLRLGRPGITGKKPATSSADPTNWKKIEPGPQSTVTRGKGSSRRRAQRTIKAWKDRKSRKSR